ncbi:Serine/threonine-protein kinase Sgk1 [Tulasnella sp. JGI-2019a]|nr:Serine/threonine-protein kinase Sgk1 [Tulasnella sp. JGI-2019a]
MDALIYMHHKGYVHWDLKPDNILLNGDGNSMLANFRISESGPSMSKLGTPGWMALEIMTGKEAHDHKVNSYAISLIFWWLWVMLICILVGDATDLSLLSCSQCSLFGPTHFINKHAIKKVINWSIIKKKKIPNPSYCE